MITKRSVGGMLVLRSFFWKKKIMNSQWPTIDVWRHFLDRIVLLPSISIVILPSGRGVIFTWHVSPSNPSSFRASTRQTKGVTPQVTILPATVQSTLSLKIKVNHSRNGNRERLKLTIFRWNRSNVFYWTTILSIMMMLLMMINVLRPLFCPFIRFNRYFTHFDGNAIDHVSHQWTLWSLLKSQNRKWGFFREALSLKISQHLQWTLT